MIVLGNFQTIVCSAYIVIVFMQKKRKPLDTSTLPIHWGHDGFREHCEAQQDDSVDHSHYFIANGQSCSRLPFGL